MRKKTMRRDLSRFSFLILLALTLAACGSDSADKDKSPKGERVSVMISNEAAPKADPSVSDFRIDLPEPAVNKDWPQAGGNIGHAPEHPALAAEPREIGSSSIGTGSNSRYKLLASPIVAEGVVYAMDSIGRVGAYTETDLDQLWRVETTPPQRDGEAMGGGIAYEKGTLYATTGFGEVLALRAKDGVILWRHSLDKPLRAAPTVAEGRLFAITIENETYALEAATGRVLWRHSGIAENAALMGASSPAVHGDTVVVAYSSGELFGLRTQNGRVVWGEVLAAPSQKGALPAIADIRGLPVIEKERVFAVSHSGRMVSIDERSGERVWEADLGGFNTPCVSGNAVFMVTNDNELVALTRDHGQILWVAQLQKVEDPEARSSKFLVWSGPVLAGGRLWLTNSLGYIKAYSPTDGKELFADDVAEPFYLPPVVADKTLFLLSKDGRLRAFR